MKTITTAAELDAFLEEEAQPKGATLTAYQREKLALERERLELQRAKERQRNERSLDYSAAVFALLAVLPPFLTLIILLLL